MAIGKRIEFAQRNVFDFLDSVKDEANNFLYLFLSKTSEWDEDEPDRVMNSDNEFIKAWNTMNALKRVEDVDIFPAIENFLWQEGNVYEEYDDRLNMSNFPFYVITSGNKIYKCISNNNCAPSIFEPNHTEVSSVNGISMESDGYRWKYMGSVDPFLVNKFVNARFLPVQEDANVKNLAVPGTIDNIKVVEPGEGYRPNASFENNNAIPVFIEGNGDANDSARCNISSVEGKILSLSIIDPGSNYQYNAAGSFPIAIRQKTQNGIVQTAYGVAFANPLGLIESVEIIIRGEGYVNDLAAETTIVQSSARGYVETDSAGRIINASTIVGETGLNFIRARAVIVDENQSGALRPVLSPIEGHGSDIFKELFVRNIVMNVDVTSSNEELIYGNDPFASFGLIYKPNRFEYESGDTLFDEAVGDAKWKLQLDRPNDDFEENESIIVRGGPRAIELNKYLNDSIRVSLDDSIEKIDELEFEVGQTIVGESSETEAVITDVVPPDVEKYSGEIYYYRTINPLERREDQTISISFVLGAIIDNQFDAIRGSLRLADLLDTNLVDLEDGSVIVFNTATNTWDSTRTLDKQLVKSNEY